MTGSTRHELRKPVKKIVRMCPVGYTSNKSPHADLDTLSTPSIGLSHDRMALARWVWGTPLLKGGHGRTRLSILNWVFTGLYLTWIFPVRTFHFFQDRTLENVRSILQNLGYRGCVILGNIHCPHPNIRRLIFLQYQQKSYACDPIRFCHKTFILFPGSTVINVISAVPVI